MFYLPCDVWSPLPQSLEFLSLAGGSNPFLMSIITIIFSRCQQSFCFDQGNTASIIHNTWGQNFVFLLLETIERRIFAQVILNYGAVLADENIAAFSHATLIKTRNFRIFVRKKLSRTSGLTLSLTIKWQN